MRIQTHSGKTREEIGEFDQTDLPSPVTFEEKLVSVTGFQAFKIEDLPSTL